MALLGARGFVGSREREEQRPDSKLSRGPECPEAAPAEL